MVESYFFYIFKSLSLIQCGNLQGAFQGQGYSIQIKVQGCSKMLYFTTLCGSYYFHFQRLGINKAKNYLAILYPKKYQLCLLVHVHIANLFLSLIKLITVLMLYWGEFVVGTMLLRDHCIINQFQGTIIVLFMGGDVVGELSFQFSNFNLTYNQFYLLYIDFNYNVMLL